MMPLVCFATIVLPLMVQGENIHLVRSQVSHEIQPDGKLIELKPDDNSTELDPEDEDRGKKNKVHPTYTVGSCMPNGTYELNECCQEGYEIIKSEDDCRAAYDELQPTAPGENACYSGNQSRDKRPTGCCLYTKMTGCTYYNPTNVIGNGESLHGDDMVICRKKAATINSTDLDPAAKGKAAAKAAKGNATKDEDDADQEKKDITDKVKSAKEKDDAEEDAKDAGEKKDGKFKAAKGNATKYAGEKKDGKDKAATDKVAMAAKAAKPVADAVAAVANAAVEKAVHQAALAGARAALGGKADKYGKKAKGMKEGSKTKEGNKTSKKDEDKADEAGANETVDEEQTDE